MQSVLFSGYPNLTSLIQAFSDVFVSATSKPINHRGDIKLNKQCIRMFSMQFWSQFHTMHCNSGAIFYFLINFSYQRGLR